MFARYFGKSVITSHGETWETMHKIVQSAINRSISVKTIQARAQQMIEIISERKKMLPKEKESLIIGELAQLRDLFFDMDFGRVCDSASVLTQFSAVQNCMKKHFSSLIFSEFPILKKNSWLLRVASALSMLMSLKSCTPND